MDMSFGDDGQGTSDNPVGMRALQAAWKKLGESASDASTGFLNSKWGKKCAKMPITDTDENANPNNWSSPSNGS